MTVFREAVSTFAEINLQNGNKGAFQYGLGRSRATSRPVLLPLRTSLQAIGPKREGGTCPVFWQRNADEGVEHESAQVDRTDGGRGVG